MDPIFLLIQILNGIQSGCCCPDRERADARLRHPAVINLAHGSFYMVGAYLAFWLTRWTGDLWLSIALGLPMALRSPFAIERVMIRFLYERDHLQQVLLTYGLILILNELQSILFGNDVHASRCRRRSASRSA